MNLQGRDLSMQMHGEDVGLLHTELQKLGFSLPPQETDEKHFGDQTYKAVLEFQQRHSLQPTGVVDEETAKRINQALEAWQRQRVVQGTVYLEESNSPVKGVVVRASDKDLRAEEPLGSAISDAQGSYRIAYTAAQFARAEKRSADLIVRAYGQDQVVVGEEGVRFNAGDEEVVDLKIRLPQPAQLSEYERLLAALQPVLQDLPPAELTEEDITFLLRECADEPLVDARRLNLLAQGARLAQETTLPTEFFYGLARQRDVQLPLDLDAILALEAADVRQALEKATENQIIPARSRDLLDDWLARLEQLKLGQGILVPRQVEARLVNEEAKEPLAGFRVQVFDLRATPEPKDLGYDFTDRQGRFGFTYIARADLEPGAEMRFRLHVFDGEDKEIHQAEIAVDVAQQEALDIPVPAAALPKPPVHPIKDVQDAVGLEVPAELSGFLEAEQIHTLEDIRLRGGFRHLENLPVAADHPAVQALEAHASLSVLSADIAVNATLINRGFSSITSIARVPRTTFVAQLHEDLGDFKAAQLHAMAGAQTRFLNNVLMGLKADHANGFPSAFPELTNTPPDLELWFRRRCDCPDCEAAVSPTAYVADLLDYALVHVKNPGDLTLQGLTSLFHQPFAELPASCDEAKDQVRQARLCIEVLRRYSRARELPAAGSRKERRLAAREIEHRMTTYTTLLTKLGASFGEIRLARTLPVTDPTLQRLAERLGIAPEYVQELCLDANAAAGTSSALTEARLEALFGLVDTTREPLSDGVKSGDDAAHPQIVRWIFSSMRENRKTWNGVEWNRHTDANGLIYARLFQDGGRYRTELYREERSRPEDLIAAGEIATPQGLVPLRPQNQTGLAGSFTIDYSTDHTEITVSAVPLLLSWRLQRLRNTWHAEDWPPDLYMASAVAPYDTEDLLPVIDPDVIGPDDFRVPLPKINAADPEGPFDIWIKRRQWVDGQLRILNNTPQLRHADGKPRFEALIRFMKQAQPTAYNGASITPWSDSPELNIPSGLAALHQSLASSEAEQAERARELVRSRLHLTVESFQRLIELWSKDRQARRDSRYERLADAEAAEVIDILMEAQKQSLYPDWRTEERNLEGSLGATLLSPRYFWRCLREPQLGEWPLDPPAGQPLIDPEIVELEELPEATVGRKAAILWQIRQQALNDISESLKSRRENNGFGAMVRDALGATRSAAQWEAHLTAAWNDLNGSAPSRVAAAEAEIATYYMTVEQFRELMQLQTRNLDPDPARRPRDEDWHRTYAFLTTARKMRVEYRRWLNKERSIPHWELRKARLPKWRASAEDRQGWQQALANRSAVPVIDPDVINERYCRYPLPQEEEFRLLTERRTWINTTVLGDLTATRTGAPTLLAGFDLILEESLFPQDAADKTRTRLQALREASDLDALVVEIWPMLAPDLNRVLNNLLADLGNADPAVSQEARKVITQQLYLNESDFRFLMDVRTAATVTAADWQRAYEFLARSLFITSVMSLSKERAEGNDISGRLRQLDVTNASFSYLERIRNLLAWEETVIDSEWEEVNNILAQVRKRREFADWRQAEQQSQILLGPGIFRMPQIPVLTFPPPEPEPLPVWRATWRDRRDWEDKLQGRIEQEDSVIAALQHALSETEEATLPRLRDALLEAAGLPATSCTERLLIDGAADGCRMTTRVAQAIETLQGLLWGLRTGQVQDTYRNMRLEADDFDEEWKWIGSYATWRAAMFVFMYPENILLPSLRKKKLQTPAFRTLVSALRENRRLTPEAACREGSRYSDYLQDVVSMNVQSTCLAETAIRSADGCKRYTTSVSKPLFYMFGQGGSTGKVYWSAYDEGDATGYAQTFWEEVDFQGMTIEKLVGSVPYKISDVQSFIFLIALPRDDGQPKLVFKKYDLQRRQWIGGTTELELPTDVPTVSLVAVQTVSNSKPPYIALQTREHFYFRPLNDEGTGWKKMESTSTGENSNSGDEWNEFILPDRLIRSTTIGNLEAAILTSGVLDFVISGEQGFITYRIAYTHRIDFDHMFALTRTSLVTVTFESWVGALTYGQHGRANVYMAAGRTQWHGIEAGALGALRIRRIVPSFLDRHPLYRLLHVIYLAGQEGSPLLYAFDATNAALSEIHHLRLSPDLGGPFEISPLLPEPHSRRRADQISVAFQNNHEEPKSILTYLEEAYYFVPMQIALQLQRHGFYPEALDWYRTVYDYSAGHLFRAIYPGLEPSGTPPTYERLEHWLQDPLDPHAIAKDRSGTYLRFTLMAIARCFLEYADAEFTLDTAESVARARTLYMTALEVLGLPVLTSCEDMIAVLDAEIGGEVVERSPELIGHWDNIAHGLREMRDRIRLIETAEELRTIWNGEEPIPQRLAQMHQHVIENQPIDPPPALGTIVTEAPSVLIAAHEGIMTQPVITNTMASVGQAVGNDFAQAVGNVTGLSLPALASADLPWLRNGAFGEDGANGTYANMEASRRFHTYSPTPHYHFCIPPNPVIQALRLHAELNLYKIRTCRNIAGMERQLEPYAAPTDTVSGLPQIGVGGQLLLPGTVIFQPTPYRYQVLMERAKQLVQLAQPIESAMLSAIERRDAEEFQIRQARQQVQLARQGVRLQDLRLKEAEDGVELAELQRDRTQIQIEHYQRLLDEGFLDVEEVAIGFMIGAAAFQYAAAAAAISEGVFFGPRSVQMYQSLAAAASTTASILQVYAEQERREQEWEFQKQLADHDKLIGAQQVAIARDQIRVVGQERRIAEMQSDFAEDTAEFLTIKFTNVELYDWMSNVLEGVYSFFLQHATAMAKLTENQLAFERQEVPPAFIQADYWEAPTDELSLGGFSEDGRQDRRGLTGSARLLQDIIRLDQYAFDTDKRKLQLTKTISLARMAPAEFQRLRETGVMRFDTTSNMFDRDFPGHYLRLIKRVRTSVIALIPPTQGIHATLSTTGLSRVVIGGDIFQTTVVRRGPESVALTSPRDATGLFDLQPQPQPEMLLPFEGIGVATGWEFRMPKPANLFDYSTIADVLLTIEYTALNSFDYQQQVIRELDRRFSADRPFSFRQEFADQWYDLHNPEQTATPMRVTFTTRREDYLANIDRLEIQQVVMYFVRAGGYTEEINVIHLRFTEQGSGASIGGPATSVDGVISTRRRNPGSWTDMIGKSPIGEWELALPNSVGMTNRFKNEEIEDILFVITFSGETPEWPA